MSPGLEHWVGVSRFQRVHRGVELTPQGSAFFRIVKNALDQIESGSHQLKRSAEDQPLRLKLPPTFALRWLVPRLARFHALHPKVDVQITTSHERADFDREDGLTSLLREPPIGPGFGGCSASLSSSALGASRKSGPLNSTQGSSQDVCSPTAR